jgi:hypothetical protein
MRRAIFAGLTPGPDRQISLITPYYWPISGCKEFLYLQGTCTKYLATWIGELTDMFPAVQNIFLDGLQPSGRIEECIGQFLPRGSALFTLYLLPSGTSKGVGIGLG